MKPPFHDMVWWGDYPLTRDQLLFPSVPLSPELKLWFEVLADALAIIYVCHAKPPKRDAIAWEEALVWLWREWDVDRKWPLSARNVCERLKLDLEAIRAQVGSVLLGFQEAPQTIKLRHVTDSSTEKIR